MIVYAAFFREWGRFFSLIVLPAFIAVLCLLAAIYLFIIPTFEQNYIDGKKDTIRQLTKVAWNVMEFYHAAENAGEVSREQAQRQALAAMERIRYGEDDRDYFWVTDSRPSLIMHPYSKELIGKDLNNFKDSGGKRLFVEIRKKVEQEKSGFVDYSWNKKYSAEVVTPKLSYVKLFEPWSWVVGTGVFLDDVEKKTSRIASRLSFLSLSAVGVVFLLLLYVGRRSYISEKQRNSAVGELERSKIKYKNLVETATEAILLFLEDKCIYSNRAAHAVLGYSQAELLGVQPQFIFTAKERDEFPAFLHNSHMRQGQYEVLLQTGNGLKKEALLTVSKMDMGDKIVSAVSFRDVTGIKKVERELGESQEQYRQLVSRLNIGVFRATVDGDLRIIEANDAFYQLLNRDKGGGDISLSELVASTISAEINEALIADGFLKNIKVQLSGQSLKADVALSLILVRDSNGAAQYCDGIIEDISEEVQLEEARERLITDLRTSELFLSQPVRCINTDTPGCSANESIFSAAEIMKRNGCTSLCLLGADSSPQGIVTGHDIVHKGVALKLDYATPVSAIMESKPNCITEDTSLFEAVMVMQDQRLSHLAVTDSEGSIHRVISSDDLFSLQRYSSSILINEISAAHEITAISASLGRMDQVIKSLVDSGAHARNITRVTGKIQETTAVQCMELAIKELGDPPAAFAFLSLGSEGRHEQTLATDQDNALIFEDVEEQRRKYVTAYFNRLGEKVCTMLDQAGYNFCKGEVMAMNAKWCQPLSVWKNYFSGWITDAKPADLLEVSIFFDFRCTYGEDRLASELKQHIANAVSHRDAFFYQLAQNSLLFKLPVDFFGNIVTESSGDHAGTFNIKHVIALIVGYARLYAINFGLEETNTLNRFDLLKDRGVIAKDMHSDITEAYNYLMQIRFRHQVNMVDRRLEPDNFIALDELSYMEKNVLKKILSQVGELQNKLNSIGKVEIFF